MNIKLNHSKWKEYNFDDIFTEYSKTNTENLEQFTVGKYGLTTKLTDVCSYDIQNHKVFEPNTLLIGIGAEEVGVSVTERGCVSPIYNTFKISNGFDSLFLKYLMPIIILQNKYKISHISTRRDYEIETSKLSKIKILLPSFEVQKEISRLLYLVDNEIESQEMILTKLEQLKQSLLELMFPSNNSNFPQLRFKNFASPWEQRKLGDIVGIYDGVHQTPNYQNGGIMFLSVENITTLKSSKFISEEDFKRDYKVFPQENDILMTRIGDVGTTNVVTDNDLKAYYVSLALLKYKSTDPYFLSNAIQSNYVQKGLANRTLKTAVPMKINKDEIGKVSVMLPLSVTEQQQIGTCFRTIDRLITLHQRKLKKYKEIKSALLDKLLV